MANDFGFNDYNALFQQAAQAGKKPDDKGSWLDPALTAAGAIAGTFVAPGAGTMAGAQLGHAAGSAGHSIANGDYQSAIMGASGLGRQFQTLNGLRDVAISPQGGGTQPTLPVPEQSVPMENQQILQRFMQNPRDPMFQSFSGRPQWNPYTDQTPYGMKAFDNGGLVTGPAMDMASQLAQMDPVQRAMLQAQQAVGPAPVAPVPAQTQQAQHPTLEALASLLPDILGSLPKPANPKNTKAIGAWAPFAGQALAAPATIAQARRKAANAPIEQANTTARSDYEAKRKAYEERKTKISDTLVGNATKPFAERAADARITKEEAVRFKHPEWEGMTREDARLAMQGAPDVPKPEKTQDPVKYRQYVRIRMNQDMNIKPFIKVRDSFNVIDRLARNANAASDLSMIFAYMKILDPDSVVREGEQATAENARGISDGLRNLYNKVNDGVKLTPLQRANYRKEAVNMMLARLAGIRETMDSFNAEAELAGVDISPVTRQFSRYASPEYEAELTRSMGATTPTTETDNGVTPKGVPMPTLGTRTK